MGSDQCSLVFVVAETAFRESHYKRPVLKPLEKSGKIDVVDASPRRKAGTYADGGLRIRFN